MSQSVELMPAVILAGGLATRLRPLTHRIPKALIEVGGILSYGTSSDSSSAAASGEWCF